MKISNFKIAAYSVLIAVCFSPQAWGAEEVVVANKTLGIHYIIAREDVRTEVKDAADERDARSIEEVIGKKVLRPVGKDNVIKKNYLQRPAAVRKGDAVVIVIEKNDLKVSAKGIAKEDGRVGVLLKVENLASGKIISGRVLEPGLVRVEF